MKERNTWHLALFLFMSLAILSFTACAETPAETLERIAASTQKTLPNIIDEYTTMTNCEILPNRTVKFTYKIKGDYSEIERKQMNQAMKKVLIQKLKERKEIEFYLVNNVRFEHLFLDASNKTVLHIEIEAMDYK